MVGDGVEINIFYMYYDLLNVYGDRGNVLILKRILEQCRIKAGVKYVTVNDSFDYRNCDLLFMGGGQDYEQITVGRDVIKNKRKALNNFIEKGGCGLYICGSYQLLGKKYIAADGRRIDGAGIFDIYTEKGNSRFTGDVVVESRTLKAKLAGFENHSGRTYINNYTPLGRVLHGHGNNGIDGTEGLIYQNTICTYMHGCCLSKNPEIAKFLILKAVEKKYGQTPKINIDETLFMKAKDDVLRKFKLNGRSKFLH